MKQTLKILLLVNASLLLPNACTPSKPSFEFTAHQLNVQIDPDACRLLAVDTVSVRYHKNVAGVCFLLHDSLHIERVGIGHQSFPLTSITAREAENFLALFGDCDRQRFENAQIVQVTIPKSLYAPKLQICYSGIINPAHESFLWFPVTPQAPFMIEITALLPARFHLALPGIAIDEHEEDGWRICRRWAEAPHADCPLKIELVSEPL